MKVIDILRKHKILWRRANEINPAMQKAGSGLNWDKYYEAVDEAKSFENREVIFDEEV